MSDTPKLIQNALHIIKDDLYIKSTHTHDFVCHTFEETEPGSNPPKPLVICVDGGLDYCRRVGALYDAFSMGLCEDWSLNEDMPFELIADRLLWGTRGENGDQPLRYRPIKEFTPEHLCAIIQNCPQRGPWHDKVVRYWLKGKTISISE